jgi:hypothetical protein
MTLCWLYCLYSVEWEMTEQLWWRIWRNVMEKIAYFQVLSMYLIRGNEENYENPNQYSGFPDRVSWIRMSNDNHRTFKRDENSQRTTLDGGIYVRGLLTSSLNCKGSLASSTAEDIIHWRLEREGGISIFNVSRC